MSDALLEQSEGQEVETDKAALRRRRLSRSTKIYFGFTAGLFAVAALAPLIAPYGQVEGDISQRLLAIGSPGHLLGTDGQGRDVLSRIIWGTRPALMAGFIPVIVGGLIGTTLGLAAGMGNRLVNSTIMRVLDVFYAFPAVLLAIAIAAALGSGISNAIIALTLITIPPVARLAETETSRLMGFDFIDAARVSGAGSLTIARRQMLPNVLPPILVYCTSLIGLCIVYAAGLSFLGLGLAPPNAEWGLMITELRQFIFARPELALIPAVVIFLTSLIFNLLGDGLRDYFDVRLERIT